MDTRCIENNFKKHNKKKQLVIDGEIPKNYLDKLDKNVKKLSERKKILNELFVDNYSFFDKYFDNYYNPNINMNMPLSENNIICRLLTIFETYLLSAEDDRTEEEKNTTKEKYEFLKNKPKNLKYEFISRRQFNKIEKNETPNSLENLYKNNKMYFILQDSNYYLLNATQIIKDDYIENQNRKENSISLPNQLNQLDESIKYYQKLREKDETIKKSCNKAISELRQNKIETKIGIKRPIVMTKISMGMKIQNLDKFDYGNPAHILALLKMDFTEDSKDLNLLAWDLNNLIYKSNLTNKEISVVTYLQLTNNTYVGIAEYFNTNVKSIKTVLNSAVKKIVNEYNKEWFDLWVDKLFSIFKPKNNIYKRCSKCGEYKLLYHFGKHPNTKDGCYPSCKSCRK